VLNEELLVPPLAIGSIPVINDEPEDRVSGPEDNPPSELENTNPVESVEITAAELTVSVAPIPVLPETFNVPVMPVLAKSE
jgi:hypothetical protein